MLLFAKFDALAKLKVPECFSRLPTSGILATVARPDMPAVEMVA